MEYHITVSIDFTTKERELFRKGSEVAEAPFKYFQEEYTKQDVIDMNEFVAEAIGSGIYGEREIEAAELLNYLGSIIEEMEEAESRSDN